MTIAISADRQSLPREEEVFLDTLPDQQAKWLTAATTLALGLATLIYVYTSALTSPWADEWRWLPQAVGSEPVTAEWLWASESGHCLPLEKLAYLSAAWMSGTDFRLMALLSAGLLVATAVIMTLVAARTRGRSSALDLLIPVLLLNWGHYMNLLWGFQLCYVMPVVLICAILLLVSQRGADPTMLRSLAVSACAIAAALCGGPGVFFPPVMAMWLLYAGVRRWRESRAGSLAIVALAATTLLPLKWYLGAMPIARNAGESEHLAAGTVLRGALQFLSMSIGKFGGESYPLSGEIVALLAGVAAARLVQVWRKNPQERLRAAGLGMFLAGGLAMALGIGLSRGWIGCLRTRYSLLGAPLVLGLYYVGTFYGPPIRPAWLRRGCVVGLLILAVLYQVKGMRLAQDDLRWNVLRMEDSVREGLPADAVAARHWEDMQDFSAASLRMHLDLLRARRVGPYRPSLAPPIPRDVVVGSMLGLESPRTGQELKSLQNGEELVQSFLPAGRGLPFRIDVETHPLRHASGQLRWSVEEIHPDGRRQTQATGELPLGNWRDPTYASLAFTPFVPAPGAHCVLRIRVEGSNRPLLEIPRYKLAGQSTTGLRAYVYYERGGAAIVAPALARVPPGKAGESPDYKRF